MEHVVMFVTGQVSVVVALVCFPRCWSEKQG